MQRFGPFQPIFARNEPGGFSIDWPVTIKALAEGGCFFAKMYSLGGPQQRLRITRLRLGIPRMPRGGEVYKLQGHDVVGTGWREEEDVQAEHESADLVVGLQNVWC